MNCIVCNKPETDPDFKNHKDGGPCYWSDRGALCSPECATKHFLKRQEDGDEMKLPAPKPVVGQ